MRHMIGHLGLWALGILLSSGVRADEGMWTFDNIPSRQIKEKYGFEPSPAWLEHLRLSALNFGGGSASFVSAEGLVITNHHVGRGWVQQISGPGEKDYIKLGYLARTREEEIRIPGIALRTLVALENVTDRVNARVKPGMSEQAAAEARAAVLKALALESGKATGLQCNPVTLYQGGEFWIYSYKVHRDVRLVMAPEGQIAAFGGDPDNFTFPRHDLDFTLFRVYEDGKPYRPANFLKWSPDGVKAGDLTFVVGHPGNTQRMATLAQMIHARDTTLPARIAALERSRRDLAEYAGMSPEHARQVRTRVYGVENSLKAASGYLRGLKDAQALRDIGRREQELRSRVEREPRLKAQAGLSWTRIEQAVRESAGLAKEASRVNTLGAPVLQNALSLVRLVEEPGKPEPRRLTGFRTEEDRKAIQDSIQRPPRGGHNPELERFLAQKALENLRSALPPSHPFRTALLAGRSPEAVAADLAGSKVGDAAFRKALLDGGPAALARCTDPAIQIARRANPLLADLARRQQRVQAVLSEHGGRIAKARFQVYGRSQYPDASGTLRLSFGPVKSYPANGTLIQPYTTFHGLYDRALAWGPEAEKGAWSLPPRWVERKGRLDLATPLNFAHQVDIIGGNSGSPVVNARGEFVGVIFDGNFEMLPGNFYYDGTVNRGVTLDARAIVESLAKVYDATVLVNELLGR